MKNTYQRIFMLMTAVVIAVLAALPVSADMGPKESILLTVENAPDENYYIDLLCYYTENNSKEQQYYRNEASATDRKMMETIDAYVSEESYGARHGCPIEPPYRHSNDKNRYEFCYMNVPEQFRVIIVTESGQVYVSEPCKRRAFNAYMTYDVQSGKVSEKAVGYLGPLALKFALTCGFTLAVEKAVFLLFKYSFGEGHNKRVFYLTNLSTQLLLYAAIETISGAFIYAELVITGLEGVIYAKLLTPKDKLKASLYAATANLVSLLLGIPVWFIVSYIIRT